MNRRALERQGPGLGDTGSRLPSVTFGAAARRACSGAPPAATIAAIVPNAKQNRNLAANMRHLHCVIDRASEESNGFAAKADAGTGPLGRHFRLDAR